MWLLPPDAPERRLGAATMCVFPARYVRPDHPAMCARQGCWMVGI